MSQQVGHVAIVHPERPHMRQNRSLGRPQFTLLWQNWPQFQQTGRLLPASCVGSDTTRSSLAGGGRPTHASCKNPGAGGAVSAAMVTVAASSAAPDRLVEIRAPCGRRGRPTRPGRRLGGLPLLRVSGGSPGGEGVACLHALSTGLVCLCRRVSPRRCSPPSETIIMSL